MSANDLGRWRTTGPGDSSALPRLAAGNSGTAKSRLAMLFRP